MSDATRLEPLSAGRARELEALLRATRDDDATALALDDEGRVTGIVAADDPRPKHVLGDLNVHA